MSFAEIKAAARRAVHDAFAIAATYQDAVVTTPVDLLVRYHTRMVRPFGDDGSGYAEVIENIDRVVFDTEALAALGITPIRTGVVTFPDYGITVKLDVRDPTSGPIAQAWTVVR